MFFFLRRSFKHNSSTFRLSAPEANEVTLNGSWEGARNIKLTKDENGVWSVTVGPLGASVAEVAAAPVEHKWVVVL